LWFWEAAVLVKDVTVVEKRCAVLIPERQKLKKTDFLREKNILEVLI
jgi:hypothetical protein